MPARDVDGLMELLGKLKDGWLTDVTHDVERVLGRPAIRFEQFAHDSAAALRRQRRASIDWSRLVSPVRIQIRASGP